MKVTRMTIFESVLCSYWTTSKSPESTALVSFYPSVLHTYIELCGPQLRFHTLNFVVISFVYIHWALWSLVSNHALSSVLLSYVSIHWAQFSLALYTYRYIEPWAPSFRIHTLRSVLLGSVSIHWVFCSFVLTVHWVMCSSDPYTYIELCAPLLGIHTLSCVLPALYTYIGLCAPLLHILTLSCVLFCSVYIYLGGALCSWVLCTIEFCAPLFWIHTFNSLL